MDLAAYDSNLSRFDFSSDKPTWGHLTHRLVRYPAKFHPPVVGALLERLVEPTDLVLDPFCGSGTLQVEASARGLRSIGTDIDPFAVQISRAKSTPIAAGPLTISARRLRRALDKIRRDDLFYEAMMHGDITDEEYERSAPKNSRPLIPNLTHWFRGYVVADLLAIRTAITTLNAPQLHRSFFLIVFASIIRNVSNADPVPVSGLEVTSHMRRLDEQGRQTNAFRAFDLALKRSLASMQSYSELTGQSNLARTLLADATHLDASIRPSSVDVVITSPPYHGAVDYYRRHQLEMFWLGLTETQKDRLELVDRYIGRPKPRKRHPYVAEGTITGPGSLETYMSMLERDPERAVAFKHYWVSMRNALASIHRVLKPGGLAALVVGHSRWAGTELSTSEMIHEMASDQFAMTNISWYPIKNRYMSYSRRNGADIDREFVLELRALK